VQGSRRAARGARSAEPPARVGRISDLHGGARARCGVGEPARRGARSGRGSARGGGGGVGLRGGRCAPRVLVGGGGRRAAGPARGAADARRVRGRAGGADHLPRAADGRVSELFVVGISWRTASVAVREKLAFRDDELPGTLRELTATLPVAEALLVSTCNRV